MSKGENFIHLKFEHQEAVKSRRDLLTSEIELLNIIKTFKKFTALRALELKLKARLFREMRKMELDVKRLEKSMPDFEIPKVIKSASKRSGLRKKEKPLAEMPLAEAKTSGRKSDSLESQLEEIQRKLKELSG